MEMNAVEMDRVERYGQAVKRVRSLYDMHRVPFGAEENLEDLITAVQHNRHFAMDFWALVGELSARERGSLDDEDTLDVVVEGATGLAVTSLPEQDGHALRQLRAMLAGVDVGAPAFLPDPIEEPADALLTKGRKDSRRSAVVLPLPERAQRRETNGTTRRAPRAENVETLVARRTIGEALSRLEQTSIELREQLAAIEEQIDALPEPDVHPENQAHEDVVASAEVRNEAASKATAAEVKPEVAEVKPAAAQVRPEPEFVVGLEKKAEGTADELVHRQSRRGEERHPVWTADAPATTVAPNGNAERASARVSRPEPVIFAPRRTTSHRGFVPEDKDDDPSIVVPLAAYAEETESGPSKGRRFALVALLLVAVGGGAYAATHRDTVRGGWERLRPSLQDSYASFVEKVGILKREATAKSNEAAPSAANSAASNAATAAPAQIASGASATTTPAATSTTPAVNGLDARSASAQPSQSSGSAAETGTTDASRLEAKSRVERESAASRAKRDSEADVVEPEIAYDPNVVRVPPTTMEANLVASRVPAYPETAKAEGIEGRVIMEAVISKAGTVDRVRVIEGDRHLRTAAEDAVMKWRYRPYIVNGSPVEVATTVKVDFRLPRGLYR